jgi:hypothetical protein
MGVRALRLVAGVAPLVPPGGSTWSQTRITGISFPMDMPAMAAS